MDDGGRGRAPQTAAVDPRAPRAGSPLRHLEASQPGRLQKVEKQLDTVANMRERSWNSKGLGKRLGVDAAAALSAGALVAPIITAIDKSIIENASGRNSIIGSIRGSIASLLLRPHTFVFSKPFALVLTVYSGTYLAANTLDTASSTISNRAANTVTHGTAKFAATSLTNLSLSMVKDSKFTRYFGAVSTPRPVPGPSYALYAARDCLTIFASFNVPVLIAPYLPMGLIPALERNVSSASAAQFLAPAAMQVLSTPLHLLGLDLYNRSQATWAERWDKVRSGWATSTMARVCRIVPAFGIGGVVNGNVRKRLMANMDA